MSRTNRLFELISVLRARRMPVTALHLARELGVSPRTIYRDIETLRSLGAPLDGQSGFGYCLREGFFLPEFAFSPDEMDALMLGLGWVRQRADPVLANGSETALSKILSARTHGSVISDELPGVITAASTPALVDPPLTAPLRDAIRRQRKIAISYEDAHGSLSHRTIWPIALVYFDDVRVLAAWCEHRAAFRHFRVDRLQVATISEERYPERRQSLVFRWRQQDRWTGVRC
jgi:predicted DNA-binding transcriptional regulator YafY